MLTWSSFAASNFFTVLVACQNPSLEEKWCNHFLISYVRCLFSVPLFALPTQPPSSLPSAHFLSLLSWCSWKLKRGKNPSIFHLHKYVVRWSSQIISNLNWDWYGQKLFPLKPTQILQDGVFGWYVGGKVELVYIKKVVCAPFGHKYGTESHFEYN